MPLTSLNWSEGGMGDHGVHGERSKEELGPGDWVKWVKCEGSLPLLTA